MKSHLDQNTVLQDKQYRLIEKIGAGGFGIAYIAEEYYYLGGLNKKRKINHSIPQKVVIKELFYEDICKRNKDNSIATQPDKEINWSKFKKRMKDEGEKLSLFEHDHIVKVRAIFEENNTIYIVMDYIDGDNLHDIIIQKNALPKHKSEKYIRQLLSAIKTVHASNIYHFDIKPKNILIEAATDNAILIDFGAAIAYDSEGNVQGNNSIISKINNTQGVTPPFCPLELETPNGFDYVNINMEEDKPATIDLYSIGATLYNCLTGDKPPSASKINKSTNGLVIAGDTNTIANKHRHIINKAMQPKVNFRFLTADDFLTALDNDDFVFVPQHIPIYPPQPPPVEPRVPKETTRNNKGGLLIGIIILGIISIASFFVYNKYFNKQIVDNGNQVTMYFNPAPPQPFEPEMVIVDSGNFIMRDKALNIKDTITVTGFQISKYEITQAQWQKVMNNNPSLRHRCDNCPVENISWATIQTYIEELKARTGRSYRLPTEAEWEFAAMGGMKTNYYTFAGSHKINDVAWNKENSENATHIVGQKKPNELGIYDMSGNVQEWCADYYDVSWWVNQPTRLVNPLGPSSGTRHVIRGGSWSSDIPEFHKITNRNNATVTDSNGYTGFRLVLPIKK